ncbi:hypothetical protein [Nocardia otitidiscaviarum]|uniref:hypothetical protein n=1 Tax=Nocardia otitidiscaviarum TaxID=1823 RepID=UPI001C8F5947|nr:hypothetical protein [Nocardia otitidiscaviarum]
MQQLRRIAADMVILLSRQTGPHLHGTLGELAEEVRAARSRIADAAERGGHEIEKASEGLSPDGAGPNPLEDSVPAPPLLIDRSIPGQRYYKQDPTSPRLYSEGTVGPGGELYMTIRTQLENGQRSELLKGAEQFRAIMKFFEGEFTSILGNWQWGSNLARFNELTARGLSSEVAAAQTWTGKQAASAGYRAVRLLNAQGDPGAYTTVEVEFTR